jgi:DNA-directed RNA polymerase specialized sigma24 family protein
MGDEPPQPTDAARKLDELFTSQAGRVLAYAIRRTADHADAEDVAAETFAIAWRKLQQVPPDPLPWLLAVARRVLANQRRGGRRRASLVLRLSRAAQAEPSSPSTDGPGIAALRRLRPDDQEILRLVAWEELDHRQVAAVMGISSNAVAIRLHRARRRFSDELMKDPDALRTFTRSKGAINGAAQEQVE